MSLPNKAIDRLFDRLAITYGAQWARMWDGLPIIEVKTAWAHELSQFAGRLDAIAWALENLPERAPNLIQFRTICRSAPRPEALPMPETKADPERMAAELAKLAEVKKAAGFTQAYDHKAWAKTLLSRHEAGERLNVTALRFAREALKTHISQENS